MRLPIQILLTLIVPLLLAARCVPPQPRGLDTDVDDDSRVTTADALIVSDCAGMDPETDVACRAADVDRNGVIDLDDFILTNTRRGALVCNGAPELCARPLNEVAFATTHNSMTSTEEGWFLPNHNLALPTQLADGVRGLMLDTHFFDNGSLNGVFLCHGEGLCNLGNQPLVTDLLRIKDYLDTHLGEVVVLIFESYVDAASTAAVFEEAGLLDPLNPESDMLYAHPGGEWPRLGDLVLSGERILVLTDDSLNAAETAAYPWYHYLWNGTAFETPFSLHPDDFPDPGFTCEDLRGNPGDDFFILNHFLTNAVGHPTFAEEVNYNPIFLDRALECETFQNHIPNFVAIDFHEIGDVFDVVRSLNGF